MQRKDIKEIIFPKFTPEVYESICLHKVEELEDSSLSGNYLRNRKRVKITQILLYMSLALIFLNMIFILPFVNVMKDLPVMLSHIITIIPFFLTFSLMIIMLFVYGNAEDLLNTSRKEFFDAIKKSGLTIDSWVYKYDEVWEKDEELNEEFVEQTKVNFRKSLPFYESLVQLKDLDFNVNCLKFPEINFSIIDNDYIFVELIDKDINHKQEYKIYCPSGDLIYAFIEKQVNGIIDFSYIDECIYNPSVYLKEINHD